MSNNTKALKDALEQSHTTYKRNIAALTRAIPTNNSRTITLKLTLLEQSLETLNACHTTWVSKSEFDDDALTAEKFNNEWLEGIWQETDELSDEANVVIHADEMPTEAPTVSIATKLLILQKQMDSLQLNVTNDLDVLCSKTSVANLPSASHAIFTEMVSRAATQLEKPYRELSQSILTLSGTHSADVVDQHETFRQNQHKRLTDVQVNLASLASSPTSPSPGAIPRTARIVDYEKGKAPTFKGSTIDYPEFKRAWQKVTASVWDDDNQIEQMKFKVDSHTKLIISRCTNMTEVWKALDDEYAQEQEVVNDVNEELKSLRSAVCSTPEYIVKLRNHLEEALKSVGGLEHLQTPDKVNILVEFR